MNSFITVIIETPYQSTTIENILSFAMDLPGWSHKRGVVAHPYLLNHVLVSMCFQARSAKPTAERFRRAGYKVRTAIAEG